MDSIKLLSILSVPVENVEPETKEEESKAEIKSEINNLDKYLEDRFIKIRSEITSKMKEQILKLAATWKEESSTLDYQGLKDVRFEFVQVEKKLNFLVNKWDKRKQSEFLKVN